MKIFSRVSPVNLPHAGEIVWYLLKERPADDLAGGITHRWAPAIWIDIDEENRKGMFASALIEGIIQKFCYIHRFHRGGLPPDGYVPHND
jgi:hypothetical protein